MFTLFPTDSVSELPTPLPTRYTLRFHAASPHTQSVLILCLSSGCMRKHLRRLPPGAVPSVTCHRVLYHLDALDCGMAVWKSAMLHDALLMDVVCISCPSTSSNLCAPKFGLYPLLFSPSLFQTSFPCRK